MRLLVPARDRKDIELEKKASEQVKSINGLNSSFICIPEVLKKSAYVSARFGKWHLGTDTQGFDISSSDGLSGEEPLQVEFEGVESAGSYFFTVVKKGNIIEVVT